MKAAATLDSGRGPASGRPGPSSFTSLMAIIYSLTVPLENLQILEGRSIAVFPAALLMVSWLLDWAAGREVRPRGKMLTWMAVYLLWCAMTVFWSVAQEVSLSWITTMALTFPVTVALVSTVAASRENLNRSFVAYVIGATIVAVTVIGAGNRGEVLSDFDQRAVAFDQDPNFLAVTMGVGVPLAVYLANRPNVRRLMSLVLLTAVPVLVIGMLTTGSRTGVVVLVMLGLVLLPVVVRRLTFVRLVGVVVAVWAGVKLAPKYVSDDVWERLSGTGESLAVGDLNARQDIWANAFGLIDLNPMAGQGTGAFLQAYASRYGTGYASHNLFLSAAIETGLIGLLLIVVVVASALGRAFMGGDRLLWAGVTAAFLAGCFTLTMNAEKLTWWVLAIAAAAAVIYHRPEAVVTEDEQAMETDPVDLHPWRR